MIESIIVPTNVEQVQTAKNPALKVTYLDKGKDYSKMIFDQGLWNIFAKNLPVKIFTEKQGNFWNVVKAESVVDKVELRDTTPVSRVATDKITASNEMTKSDWADKDRITRKSIERQKSLELATNLCIADKITLNQVGEWAKKFESYLEGEDMKPQRSRLAEEAQALGGVYIEEEND